MCWSRPLVAASLLLELALTAWGAEPIVIASGRMPAQPKQPQLAVDEKGTIHATYGAAGAVYYTRCEVGGTAFSSPVKLGEVAKLALGMRRGPRIVAGAGAIVIAAIGHEDGSLRAWRSTDGGQKWEGPVTINDSPRSAGEGLHAMARGPKGELCCVWLDHRDQERGKRLFGATSTDGGKTWSANREIYRSPSGSICECCHPTATYGPDGKLLVMWRNSLGGMRDMYWSASTDGGRNFTPAEKLGQGTWPLKGCPMDGGNLAVGPKGEIFTAWRRDKEVFLSTTSGSEQRLDQGQQPWIAADAAGQHTVWLQQRPGRLMYQGAGMSQPQELARQATDPVIVAAPGGKGLLVAAWEETRGQDTVLVCRVLNGK